MYIDIFLVMFVREPCMFLVGMEAEEDIWPPGIEEMYGWEPPCQCGESNPDLLKKKQVFLNTEPSSQSLLPILFLF